MNSSNNSFSEGVALVVGGTGGIGSAICEALAAEGSNVALTYYSNEKAAKEVVQSVEALGQKATVAKVNLEDPASIKLAVDAAVAEFGSIHSVVYASGPSFEFLYINEITNQQWAKVMSADINGCFNLIEATLPQLKKQQSGSYVAIITAAVDRAPPRDILSAAPKAAIELLVKGVAREEGRNGIRANCVGPGYINAGLGLHVLHEHTQDYVQKMIKAVPLKRAGEAEEVANAVVFLLSDKASYISGASIPVAGGLQLA